VLSQARWMLGVAIGVAVIVAVWLEPDVRDPSGEPARPRPERVAPSGRPSLPTAEARAPASPDSASVRWQRRLAAYWAELDAGMDDPALRAEDRAAFQETLRARHFDAQERPVVRALDAGRER
jgi:hypothetical protein